MPQHFPPKCPKQLPKPPNISTQIFTQPLFEYASCKEIHGNVRNNREKLRTSSGQAADLNRFEEIRGGCFGPYHKHIKQVVVVDYLATWVYILSSYIETDQDTRTDSKIHTGDDSIN